jgi:hypothetical protein
MPWPLTDLWLLQRQQQLRPATVLLLLLALLGWQPLQLVMQQHLQLLPAPRSSSLLRLRVTMLWLQQLLRLLSVWSLVSLPTWKVLLCHSCAGLSWQSTSLLPMPPSLQHSQHLCLAWQRACLVVSSTGMVDTTTTTSSSSSSTTTTTTTTACTTAAVQW